MNHRLWWVLGLAVSMVAVAFGVKAAVDGKRPRGTNTEQIMQMLYDGERAAERRSASGVSKYLAESYEDSLGNNKDRMRYLIRDGITRYRGLDVSLTDVQIQIDPGDQSAMATFQVRFNGQMDGPVASTTNLSLRLVRERVYYYWLFPGEEWRIQSADGYLGLE
jgi:hypothetical protein